MAQGAVSSEESPMPTVSPGADLGVWRTRRGLFYVPGAGAGIVSDCITR